MRPLLLLLAILITNGSCSRGRQPEPGTSTSPAVDSTHAGSTRESRLIAALRDSFRSVNPKLRDVGVLDLRSWDFVGPRVVLGWAIVPDRTFRGDFHDEMFGVFVVNDSLTRVERMVATIPTPRWFDYDMHLGRLTGDSIEVVGRGMTYGDEPMKRTYRWGGYPSSTGRRREDPSDSLHGIKDFE